ncbi:transposase [Spirillospora sp. NPDC000708]
MVYTANAIESLNARFRQATRRRGHFPTEQAALKVLYLFIRQPLKGRPNVSGETPGWKAALNALSLYYGDRITLTESRSSPHPRSRRTDTASPTRFGYGGEQKPSNMCVKAQLPGRTTPARMHHLVAAAGTVWKK